MSTALASIQEKIKQQLALARGTVATPTAKTISTRGKVFTLPTGQSSQGPLSAIILDWRNFNKYYTAAYNPQKPSPPDCFAISAVIADMAPHELAAKPASEVCVSCTFNKFGSAPTGRGKACRNTVRLAIVPADFGEETEPMVLNVSPTGIRPWSGYVNSLLVNELMPINMITEISFDANAAYPTLLFKAVRPVGDKLEHAWRIREAAQAMLDAPPATDGD
jgi:hypothetical protein